MCLQESVAKFLLTRSINAEALVEIVFDASVPCLDLIERRSQVLRFHTKQILCYRGWPPAATK